MKPLMGTRKTMTKNPDRMLIPNVCQSKNKATTICRGALMKEFEKRNKKLKIHDGFRRAELAGNKILLLDGPNWWSYFTGRSVGFEFPPDF
jgi:hypothetical protein